MLPAILAILFAFAAGYHLQPLLLIPAFGFALAACWRFLRPEKRTAAPLTSWRSGRVR